MLLSTLPRHHTLLLLLTQALTSSAQCYWNTGTAAIDEYQPCFPERSNSACCGLNKSGGQPNDICTSEGFCYVQVSPYTGHIMLNPCTDRSWGSDCPQICPSSVRSTSGIYLLPCAGSGKDRWCCSTDGSECCDSDFQLDIGQLMLPTTNSTSSNTTGSTSVTTVTSTVQVTSLADSDSDSNSDSKVTAVGAGVGAGLGACLIATIAALWFQRRLYLKKAQELKEQQESAAYGMRQNTGGINGGLTELPENNKLPVYELGEETQRDGVGQDLLV